MFERGGDFGAAVSQTDLQELFAYTEDGQLIWLKLTSKFMHKSLLGTQFGCINSGSRECRHFRKGKVYGDQYSEHQLVFLYHYGYIPKKIRHLNGNITDNRIENLEVLV